MVALDKREITGSSTFLILNKQKVAPDDIPIGRDFFCNKEVLVRTPQGQNIVPRLVTECIHDKFTL